MNQLLINAITVIQEDAHAINVANGWWDKPRNDGEQIALMHSELSEALEAIRHGNPASEHIPAFTALEEELADVVIRVMDFSAGGNHRLAEAIAAKLEFNKTRGYKHGGKTI